MQGGYLDAGICQPERIGTLMSGMKAFGKALGVIMAVELGEDAMFLTTIAGFNLIGEADIRFVALGEIGLCLGFEAGEPER